MNSKYTVIWRRKGRTGWLLLERCCLPSRVRAAAKTGCRRWLRYACLGRHWSLASYWTRDSAASSVVSVASGESDFEETLTKSFSVSKRTRDWCRNRWWHVAGSGRKLVAHCREGCSVQSMSSPND